MPTSRLFGGAYVASLPSIQISPAVGGTRPATIISSVVLPEPEGPSRVRNSPSRSSRVAPASAVTAPYVLVAPRIESFVFAAVTDRPSIPPGGHDAAAPRPRRPNAPTFLREE